MRVQLQLRRPSDGICSDPRAFDFLPLDSGRGFWTAKRLKTNYSVFSSILTADQQRMLRDNKQPEEQLKRKSRVLQPAAVAATTATPETTMVSSFPPPPPPARNFHSLSLVPHVTSTNNSALTSTATSPEGATLLQQQQQLQLLQLQRQRQLQQQQQLLQQRPLSMLSDTSSVVTVATDASSGKQSLNDVLSLAGREENMSVYSVDLSGAGDMTFQALMKMEPDQSSVDPVAVMKPAASVTSVDTIKENIIKQEKETTPVNADNNNMDVDVNTLYDDVMQCVYDDVAADASANTTEPPAPPARVASVLLSTPTETSSSSSTSQETILLTSPDKPLPETPSKLPTILQSMMGSGGAGTGKGDTLSREKKRKEQEELKRRYKEEREVEKQKQKERKKKATATAAGGKGSLFQRVLHRTKSQSELAGVNNNEEENEGEVNANSVVATPEISSHNSAVADAALKLEDGGNSNSSGSNNNNNSGGGDPTEADLNELQQFLESGDLDHLDNMVSEFAKQYLPGTELEESAANSANAEGGNNNNNNVQQQQQQGRVS